jgi:HK97 family phage portal protein
MATRETTGKPVSAGLLARVNNGLKGFVSGITGQTWFSPGQPIAAQEPEAARQLQYAPGYNIQIEPRANDPITFAQLRGLADNYDLLRTIIETRKDQIGALDFEIVSREGKGGNQQRIQQVLQFLRYPDGLHPWDNWLRTLLEDLLVIDAPTLEPRFTKGGQLYGLDYIDGATIKRVIDAQGRTPLPPSPAYQQVLYGIPAVDFTRDQLIYWPRNYRTHRIYGFSPVEQIIMTINIALRRQLSQLDYFTAGNVPDMFINVPKEWSAEQTERFQKYFNTLLSGDTSNRRKALLVPSDLEPHPVKEPPLKNEFDEWLARVVCFAFSIPPNAFVNQQNRATAEAAQETAQEEGLAPLKQWVKTLMDYILAKYFQSPELEFKWQLGEQEQDPLTKAQIQQIYVQSGIMQVNEVREQLGLTPLSPEELNPNPDSNNNDEEEAPVDDE